MSSLFGAKYLAVLELEATGISTSDAKVLTQTLTSNIIDLGDYIVVERANIDKILKEQKFQSSGCTDSECAVEIGQLLNADLTIIGTAGKVGSTYTIQARIINVETGEAIQSAKFTHKGEIDELLSIGIESIAHELLGLPYQKKIKPTATGSGYGGTLILTSDPEGAEVYIGGNYFDNSPLLLQDFPSGEYDITLKLEGYEDYTKSVKLLPRGSEEVTAVLTSLPTYIKFSGNPDISIVNVEVGGRSVNYSKYGNSSFSDINKSGQLQVDPGTHIISITKIDFTEYLDTIKVGPGKTAEFKYELFVTAENITFQGAPPTYDVQIEVDGRTATIYDGKFKTTEGKHTIKISKDNYFDYLDTVNVKIGKPVDISYTLEKNAGYIKLKVKPNKAKVYIDNNWVNFHQALEMSPGKHTIRAELKGYDEYSGEFEIKLAETIELSIELIEQFGHLDLKLKPYNAKMYFNDSLAMVLEFPSSIVFDNNTIEFKLKPGLYDVRAEKPFYFTKTLPATIKNKERTDLTLTLEAKIPKKARQLAMMFPGLGHRYSGQSKKGFKWMVLGAVSTIGTYTMATDYMQNDDVYKTAETDFLAATNPDDIKSKKIIYQNALDEKNLSLAGTAGFGSAALTIWIWNMIDVNKYIPSELELEKGIILGLNDKGQLEATIAF